MPTQIEQAHLDQGYRLPDGLTGEVVADRRARWEIPVIFVLVAVARGCLGWGAAHVGGARLGHP